jgi:hypothetical protein
MQINRKMNLVIPIENEDQTIYVHSMPITRATFEQHFMELSKVYAAIYSEGLGFAAGPRVAAMMLRKVAESIDTWDGPNGVKNTLINEIHRLSNVIHLGKNGWESITLYDAIKENKFTTDQLSEVENLICFFTVVSVMMRTSILQASFKRMNGVWGTQTVSLNCTEYAASLQMLTTEDNFGEKSSKKTSSVPS